MQRAPGGKSAENDACARGFEWTESDSGPDQERHTKKERRIYPVRKNSRGAKTDHTDDAEPNQEDTHFNEFTQVQRLVLAVQQQDQEGREDQHTQCMPCPPR